MALSPAWPPCFQGNGGRRSDSLHSDLSIGGKNTRCVHTKCSLRLHLSPFRPGGQGKDCKEEQDVCITSSKLVHLQQRTEGDRRSQTLPVFLKCTLCAIGISEYRAWEPLLQMLVHYHFLLQCLTCFSLGASPHLRQVLMGLGFCC